MSARAAKEDEITNPLFGKFEEVAEALVQPHPAQARRQAPKPRKPVRLEEGQARQPDSPTARQPDSPTARHDEVARFADLFCGIGGFHVAAASLGLECVFACDIDKDACDTYEQNFGLRPHGNIAAVRADAVPDHDILFAGLPCQPFSIIGNRGGFPDARGNLFLEAARIIAAKRPHAVVIENVRQFATIAGGKPLACVVATLEALGYAVEWRILNALNFGLPQKRERILIVATMDGAGIEWPEAKVAMTPLADVLEPDPAARHFVSARIRRSRQERHKPKDTPSIWHENKAGNVSSHPWSCALRAGASYNYLLVNGERRLTPREMFRLQGFPDDFTIPETDAAARRLTGNAVPVPMVKAVIAQVLHASRIAAKAAG